MLILFLEQLLGFKVIGIFPFSCIFYFYSHDSSISSVISLPSSFNIFKVMASITVICTWNQPLFCTWSHFFCIFSLFTFLSIFLLCNNFDFYCIISYYLNDLVTHFYYIALIIGSCTHLSVYFNIKE